MKYNRWFSTAFVLSILILCSCATPSSPTGGPPDKQGPTIIRTEPETGTTNFDRRSIVLHFSEFVRRASLREAIVVEPDIGISYKLDWGRKSVEIKFDRDIPDLTTLILTVGTELEDVNGNGMAEPQKIAVSTGPEIDDGEFLGKIINAQTGERKKGMRVLLYREPFDLEDKANYIASTDTSGQFQFSYLREGKYKAFWVDDRNRNKIWEREQERAQPFGKEFMELSKSGADTLGTLYVTTIDTTQPTLQGIGLFSNRRMRMRFSEAIELTDSVSIAVTDTVGGVLGRSIPLYVQPNEPYILFAHSEQALAPTASYKTSISGITDFAGNLTTVYDQTFTGSSQEDTTKQRIIKRNTVSGYYPREPFEVTYAKVIDEPAIRDSLKVVEGDTLLEEWPNVEIDQNVLRILPQQQWQDGIQYEVRVWDPIVEDYRKFKPEIWHQSQMGALNITLEDTTVENLRLNIRNEESDFYRDTTFSGQIELTNLPPLKYKVSVFHDQNNNGSWDYGQVSPFEKPEPYFIQTLVPVKKGLTGDLTITFQN